MMGLAICSKTKMYIIKATVFIRIDGEDTDSLNVILNERIFTAMRRLQSV
jgi:hypothetical protein